MTRGGDMVLRVVGKMKEERNFGWLNDLSNSPLLTELDTNKVNRLIGFLGKPEWRYPNVNALIPQQRKVDPKQKLKIIKDWWNTEGKTKLPVFLNKTFPAGIGSAVSSDVNDHNNRRNWMALFLLGISHTMGRCQPEQHRSFLERCLNEKWLDTFADADYDPKKWMKIIEDYFERPDSDMQHQHLEWLKNFPSIYVVSRYLSEYITLFVSIGRVTDHFNMADITNSRKSHLFQRGGIDVPPIEKNLGYGVCFILRELVRLKVLDNPFIYEHCFVPQYNLRQFFVDLGCELDCYTPHCDNSKVIYHFLQEHLDDGDSTFDHCFDIPFQMILRDSELFSKYYSDFIT